MQSFAPERPEPRALCTRCLRPVSVCYCAQLPRIETTTKIVILQHPRERFMPIGTARMASLCLPQTTLHVGMRWGEHPRLAAQLSDPARPPIFLYPGPDAKDILREPPKGPVTLVVVDGTWAQARGVVRDNPILQALPRYAFAAPEPSIYRIRKEPSDAYVSTIEALMHVLGALEGDPERFRSLLAPMRAMIDSQIACQAGSPRRSTPRQPRTAPPRHPLPEMRKRWEDLVILVGEANAWPYSTAGASPRDELVHLVLHRPATGETFSRVIAPQRPLSPTATHHTGLTEERLLAGEPRDTVIAELAAWLRPTDLVGAWGHYGTSLVIDAGGTLPRPCLDLRAAAYRFHNTKIGTLDEYALSRGPVPAPLTEGRGGLRVALLAQILDSWRAL